MRQGFTLIQLSILLTVASLVAIAILPSSRSTSTAQIATTSKLNTVLSALRQYEGANAALPCPADASLPTGSTNYGIAAANPGVSTNCTGGTPQSNYVDTSNNVAIGMVPVKALGLSNDYALDALGRSITYAVDTNATTCFSGTLAGQISVTDNGVPTSTIAALVSHGTDGHGAWLPLTGTSGTALRLNASSTDTDEHLVNAHGINGGGFPSNYSTINSKATSAEATSATFVRKSPTSTFDDIVVYKNNLWTLDNAPANYPFVKATVSALPNGDYILNQNLTITLTFTAAVTFTGGPPSIQLTVGSNTRYAAYVSGNGTATLTFAYKVLPTDYAPSGISVVSPIYANGATFTSSTGYCVSTIFTPPASSGVYVSAPSGISADASTYCNSGACLYLMDTNNSRLVKYDFSKNYITQIGSSGTSSSNFANPGFITSGLGTNFYSYTIDTGNNRIVRWKNTSATPSSATAYGSLGTSAGQFSSPMGIAIDAANNCTSNTACLWVADTGNNRVQRCDAALANCTVVASGTYNGLTLSQPTGIAVDAVSTGCTTAHTPCIYIVDTGNNRILKFSGGPTPAYVSTFGTAGTAGTAGKFNNPTGIAVDNGGHCAGSTNCLWIADTSSNQVQSCSVNMGGGTTNCSILSSLASCTSPISPTTFNNPMGMTWTGTYVGVVDGNNSRVIFLGSDGSCSGAFGSSGSGNTNFNF